MSMLSQNTSDAPVRPLNRDLRKPALIGGIGFAVMVGVLGLWAATTVISGAVIASGQAMVQGDSQVVQSLDGGVVDSIAVENGDHVAAGEVMMRLDPTLLSINLDIAKGRLAGALTRQARLLAEQQRLDTLTFNYPALPFEHPDTSAYEATALEVFHARRAVLTGGREQLAEVFLQFENRLQGLNGQINATQAQIDLIDGDLANMRTLADQGLARQSQMSELQRTQSELSGRLATLEAELAQLGNQRRDQEMQTLQTERSFMEEVVTDLRDTSALVEELTLEIVTHSAQLDRIDIRAPVDGIVHEMQTTTVGGIVAPGGVILEVIPTGGDAMTFQVRVDPHSIDQVWQGQGASVTLASLDPQNTPQLEARVTRISPDVVSDPQTGEQFYRAVLAVSQTELDRLGGANLVPGMPIEAYLETGERTVLAYLLQPLNGHLRRAFRE